MLTSQNHLRPNSFVSHHGFRSKKRTSPTIQIHAIQPQSRFRPHCPHSQLEFHHMQHKIQQTTKRPRKMFTRHRTSFLEQQLIYPFTRNSQLDGPVHKISMEIGSRQPIQLASLSATIAPHSRQSTDPSIFHLQNRRQTHIPRRHTS